VRNAVAFAASGLVHLLALLVLLTPGVSEYDLAPPPETPPVEVEIIPPLEIERPPPTPPLPRPSPTLPVAPTPTPQPAPAQPAPPQPTPAPKTAPQKPAVVRPLLAPSAPPAPVVAKTAPSAVLSQTPIPSLAPQPTPAPPASKAPTAAAAPAPTAANLNIHKAQKEAPAGTPTLPMAPSPAQPPAGGGRPTASGEPALGGSRLEGLVPYPGGVLPNGGGGLRGSLVGCANAQAVGLSSVERAHCESRFGAAAASAPHLDGIAPDKRAAFDREVERADRDRAYRNSSTSSALTGLGGVAPDQTKTTIKLPQ
jgi:hypothetical protein